MGQRQDWRNSFQEYLIDFWIFKSENKIDFGPQFFSCFELTGAKKVRWRLQMWIMYKVSYLLRFKIISNEGRVDSLHGSRIEFDHL